MASIPLSALDVGVLQVIDGGRANKYRFLLLQGPIGPFFKNLQKTLNSDGHDAWRVTFNAGDRLYCGANKTIGYTGKADDLEIWLRSLLQNNHFDAVILFGSERKIHFAARTICRAANIPVICLEEGYIRPGYIAIEEDGNNWNSPIAGKLPPQNFEGNAGVRKERARSSLNVMGRYATKYYIAHGLFSGFHERLLFHKPTRARIVNEAFCWIRNAFRKQINLGRNAGLIENLLEFHEKRYFLVPFQVCDDSQLAPEAAFYWTNESLAAYAIESFAKHAPKDYRLVFKVHPLDRGHKDYSNQLRNLAQLHGVADRVDLLDNGSLGLMIRHSAGLVTINSSSGISAINHGRPIALFGRAIYAHPALATLIREKSDLHNFWVNAAGPTAELSTRYVAWLREKCLAIGDFYLDHEIPGTVDAVIERSIKAIENNTSKHRTNRWNGILEEHINPEFELKRISNTKRLSSVRLI
jgi:capsular polysaccharide export protein